MASALTEFVRDGLLAGHDRARLTDVMAQAGWSRGEIDEALSTFADIPFVPPVPRPGRILSARDIFVYALIAISLGTVAYNIVEIAHGMIDYWLLGIEPYLSWSIATLLVFAPFFVILQGLELRALRRGAARDRSLARISTVYLILLASALILLSQLVNALHSVLTGGLTTVFLLKALVVGAVGAAVFLGYLPRSTRGTPRE